MTVSAQDSHPYPIYNARFRLIVPLLDADGDPISPSSPDTEISQDQGTFADATNEAVEIATSSGIVYVDLIATEMDTKSTTVRVQSTGAKTTVAVLNPRRLPILRAGTAAAGGNSTITLDSGASSVDDYYVGSWVNITNDTPSGVLGQARMIVDYVGSTRVATIEGTWGTNPSSSSTFQILISEWSQVKVADLISPQFFNLIGNITGTITNVLNVVNGVTVTTNNDKTGYSLSTPQNFNLIGNVSGTMTTVLNVTNPVTVGTNNDKTGYSLSSPQSVNIIGNISGTITNTLNVVNPVTAGNVTGSVFGNVNGSVASVIAPVTVGTNSDKTGYSLSSPQAFNLIGNISGTLSNVLNVVNPVVAGVVTGSVLGNVNGSVNSVTLPVGISTGSFIDALVDKVWDEDVDSAHQTAGTAGKKLDDAGSAGDPWNTALPGSYVAGTAGHTLASRMPTGAVLVGDKTGFSLSSPQTIDINGTITNVTNVVNPVTAGVVTGSVLGNVNGSVNSVTQPVTVGTNNDKTGYSLSTPQSFNLIGNVSGTLTNVLNVVNPVVAGVVTGSVLGNVNGSVNSVNQPVGISTGSFFDALVDKVWDEDVDSSHQTAGSAGKKLDDAGSAGDPWGTTLGGYAAGTAGHTLASRMPTGTVLVGDKTGFSLSSPQSFNLIGNVSGTITTVLNVTNPVNVGSITGSVGSVVNPVVAGVVTGSVLGNVNGSVTSVVNPVTAGNVTGSVFGNVNGSVNTVLSPVGISTGLFINAISDQVWDETIAGHLLAGSTGEKLNSAASAGDPWSTALPGAYGAGTAGQILSSRMPTGTVIVGTNQDKTGYSLSSPQSFNLIGNISGTLSRVIDLTNAGSAQIDSADMTEIASRVWLSQYAPIRTLTTVAGDALPPLIGEDVFAIRGDTFVWNITGLDLSNLSKIQFSVKKKYYNDDSESLIFVETGAGLLYIDGVAGTAANGAITYSQPSGTAQIRVEAQEMAKLDVDSPLFYDVQIIRTTGTYVSSPLQGYFHVTWDSTRST